MLLLPSTINQTVGVTGEVVCMPDAHVPGALEPAVLRVFRGVVPLPAAPVTVINPFGAGFAVVPTLAPLPLAPEAAREPLGSLLSALHAPSINAAQLSAQSAKDLGDRTVLL